LLVFDWLEQPCEFWTPDGLDVGGLLDGRDPHDGHDLSQPGSMPDRLYTWHGVNGKWIGRNNCEQHSPLAADDFRTGGEVAELPDGSVVFLGQEANNNPSYRLIGWDNFVRQHGEVTIFQPVAAPSQPGTGRKAEVFSTPTSMANPLSAVRTSVFGLASTNLWPRGSLYR
jgi:hypothetical protein